MISDIEFLETVCERMQQVGLVQSKADFSARMLGKGPSYLTSMRARGRQVPNEVMEYLAEQLERGITDDEAALACLADTAKRREHERKHRADMLRWVERHRTPEPEPEFTNRDARVTTFSIMQRIARWLMRRRPLAPEATHASATGL